MGGEFCVIFALMVFEIRVKKLFARFLREAGEGEGEFRGGQKSRERERGREAGGEREKESYTERVRETDKVAFSCVHATKKREGEAEQGCNEKAENRSSHCIGPG